MPEPPMTLPEEPLPQLTELIERMRDGNAGLPDRPGAQQLWNKRAHANGGVPGARQRGQVRLLGGRRPDEPANPGAPQGLAWGMACRRGDGLGREEIHAITGNPAT